MTVVTCVGVCVQDHILTIETPLRAGQKHAATSSKAVIGGPAANAALTIARLGGTARLIAKLGTDTVSHGLESQLKAAGIDVAGIRRTTGHSSQSHITIDQSGERTIVNHTDPRLIGKDQLVALDEIAGSDVVLADLRWPAGAISAIDAANELDIPSIVDIDLTTSPSLERVIDSASHLVFSRSALAKHAGTVDVDDGLRSIARTTSAFVGVTLGADGFTWIDDGRIARIAAYEVAAIDTLGAGDVFHGAFALAIGHGKPLENSIRFASASAAFACQRPSGEGSFPTASEVDHLLETAP